MKPEPFALRPGEAESPTAFEVVLVEFFDALAMMTVPMQEQVRERLRKQSFQPELTHRGAGNLEIPLPWEVESAGTHRLFALAGLWLSMLSDGDVVCIDELDAGTPIPANPSTEVDRLVRALNDSAPEHLRKLK